MEITMASYSNNFVNLIIRPAGRSRSFKWLGRGNIDKIPHIPRPIFIPRWIPRERPEYVAKWVPTTPGPQSIKQSSHQSGYGTPKTNTVVQKQKLPLKHDIAPAKVPAALALPPPTAKAPTAQALPLPPVKAPATPIQLPPPPPANNYVSIPSHNLVVPPTGYNSPLAEDIIPLPQNNVPPPTVAAQYVPPVSVITQPPLPQPNNIIPETAIRNTFTNSVPEFPGEPSFSALVQDPPIVDISGFSQINPNSVITSDQGNNGIIGNTINVDSNIIVTDDSVSFLNPEVSTFSNLPASNTFVLNNANDAISADLSFDDSTVINEGDDILFVVDSDSTLNSLTTEPFLFNEDATLQSLQENSGKSFNAPIISQTINPIQSNIVSHQNTDTLFIEDLAAHVSQPNVVTKLNNGVAPNDNFLVTQNPQFDENPQITQKLQPDVNFQPSANAQATGGFQPNENFQTNGELQLNQGFQPNELPEFIIDSGSNEGFQELKDSLILSPQELEPQQNSQANRDNEIFLVDTETTPTNTEFQSDQEAQFSNFQLGQRINFRPLPIQQHNAGVGRGSFPPSLPRPALVAPPASPVLASERSDKVAPPAPSGRSFSTNMVIPQPVPIPLGPLASVTLDFPKEGPGVRQARVASGLLPFGSRLHPRLARRFQSRRSFTFGK